MNTGPRHGDGEEDGILGYPGHAGKLVQVTSVLREVRKDIWERRKIGGIPRAQEKVW